MKGGRGGLGETLIWEFGRLEAYIRGKDIW